MLEKTTPKMDERVTAKDYQLIAAQVLKILKKNKKEQEINWDFSAAASKGDIIGLKDTIADNKNDTNLKIAEIKSDLEKTIAKLKSDTDLKLKDIEKKIVESKNVLLQWVLGMMTGYTILLIVILRFFEK
eukprot:TRINITY_DN8996_c1_g1_i1.p1 TRINITY_DN8996_c1_g1~~TRINITY_DN8996_c1_g1_i1.p1  ORF type:complete len:130 (-),score=5.00 TRINITY_DN8996_c1_g1_i1:128-517(-)